MSDTARVAVIDSETSGLPEQGQAEVLEAAVVVDTIWPD